MLPALALKKHAQKAIYCNQHKMGGERREGGEGGGCWGVVSVAARIQDSAALNLRLAGPSPASNLHEVIQI